MPAFSLLSEIQPNGIPCPLSPKGSKGLKFHRAMKEFKEHGAAKHGLKANLSATGNGTYYCHAPECNSAPLTYKAFLDHNEKVHSAKFLCLDCNTKVGQKAHSKDDTDHVLQAPWEFPSPIWPTIDFRCECSKNIVLPENLKCATEFPTIQTYCKPGVQLETLRNLLSKKQNKEMSNADAATHYASMHLKVSPENLPRCIVELIFRRSNI